MITTGVTIIDEFVKTLGNNAGVYRMLNENGDALYVGKAKNLKKRVTNYTRPEKQSIRIQRMIAETAKMECTITHTEAEALLLEANLIKKLKPRYNILLRDDKSFPYILITDDHDYPLITKHRGAKKRKGEYFGPFASVSAVNKTLTLLHKAFLLRNCSNNIFENRTRPCLQYQIKRCTAPCVNKVTKEQYAEQVAQVRNFLTGKSRDIQNDFTNKMERASRDLDYETAALYRDRIKALTRIQAHQTIHIDNIKDADIHTLFQEQGRSCIQVFFFRGGQNFGSRAYFPRHEKDESAGDILSAFMAQFYTNKPIPNEILISHKLTDKDILEEALRTTSGHKVTITKPVRGAKKQLIEQGILNAKEALARRMAQKANQSDMFERFKDIFNLDDIPERIEVYDNSHISGTDAGGAMIVATSEGFLKSAYRKFNMKEDHPDGDDYGMMREMLSRRFQALLKTTDDMAEDTTTPTVPDLILIDGGAGQLNTVLKVMQDLDITDIAIAAIAKGPKRNAGEEKLFLPNQEPFQLPKDDPALYLLQQMRDEAHRFAITTHRAKRRKKIGQNPLDQIPGIGAKRKKALLLHFGSAKAVAQAGLLDLQKVDGISKAFAEKIYGFFNDRV